MAARLKVAAAIPRPGRMRFPTLPTTGYPNWNQEKPGFRYFFHAYEPDEGWEMYGEAEVGKDGRQIIPEASAGIYEFNGAGVSAGVNPATTPPAPNPCECDGAPNPTGPEGETPADADYPMFGDPVSASSGVYLHSEIDLRIRDVLPLVLSRTYVSMDSVVRPFGIGTTHSFEKYLWRTSLSNWNRIALILPN